MTALNLRTLGATGNGVDDDSPAWREAMTQIAAAGSGTLIVPSGTYKMPPFGAAPYCLDATADNVNLILEQGAVLQQPVGLPARSISLLRLNERRNWIIAGGGVFDGNWGNAVGLVDDHTGINHTTQVDPKCHLLQIRGSEQIVVEDIQCRQAYGDAVWIGHGADPQPSPGAHGVYLTRCRSDMTARNGLTLGGPCDRVIVTDCHWQNVYACAIDFESTTAKNCMFVRGSAGLWWNPNHAGDANFAVSVDGHPTLGHVETVSFDGVEITGSTIVQRARGVEFRRCRMTTKWIDPVTGLPGRSWCPFLARFDCDRIFLDRNEIRTANLGMQTGTPSQNNQNTHAAAVQIDFYASGTTNRQPRDVRITENRIFAEHGIHGIRACGSGANGGLVDIVENRIELFDRGLGAGGRAIDIYAERPGMRVRTRGNRSVGAVGEHLRARFTSAANAMLELDIAGERNVDSPACTAVVRVDSPRYVGIVSASDIASDNPAMTPVVGI